MWTDEYNKKVARMDTSNECEYYIMLDQYLDFILSSTTDQLKGVKLVDLTRTFNLLHDPILNKIRDYRLLPII